jgi:hypothetical protein
MESTASSAPSLSQARDTLAQEAVVRSLMSKDLVGDPAREASMITRRVPAGERRPGAYVHRF